MIMNWDARRADAKELRHRAGRCREIARLYRAERAQPLIDLAGDLESLAECLEGTEIGAPLSLAGAGS